jgi:hypothetical protein
MDTPRRALCGFVLLRERSSAPSLHPGAGGKSRPVVTAAGRGAWQDAPSGEWSIAPGENMRIHSYIIALLLFLAVVAIVSYVLLPS